MHQPHPIDIAAKASGEPVFREVGVGPWAETHPGEPRPDDPQSVNYDRRFDSSLLDEGDRRNVLDQYRYWAVAAIKADLDARGRHDLQLDTRFQHRIHGAHGERVPSETCAYRRTAQVES